MTHLHSWLGAQLANLTLGVLSLVTLTALCSLCLFLNRIGQRG